MLANLKEIERTFSEQLIVSEGKGRQSREKNTRVSGGNKKKSV